MNPDPTPARQPTGDHPDQDPDQDPQEESAGQPPLCRHRRIPLTSDQPAAWCDKPLGHWPRTDHHWVATR